MLVQGPCICMMLIPCTLFARCLIPCKFIDEGLLAFFKHCWSSSIFHCQWIQSWFLTFDSTLKFNLDTWINIFVLQLEGECWRFISIIYGYIYLNSQNYGICFDHANMSMIVILGYDLIWFDHAITSMIVNTLYREMYHWCKKSSKRIWKM